MISEVQSTAENLAQQRLIKYSPRLSQAMQSDTESDGSGLLKAIASINLSDNEELNSNLLQMVVVFYEANVLEEHRSILQNHEFIRKMGAFMRDDLQIRLIPFLTKKRYNIELMQLILSKEEYYRSYDVLIQFGLTQDAPQYLALPLKQEQLTYINQLVDEHARQLCLIFWAKGNVTLIDIQKIIAATEQYPLLAKTLIALDQNKEDFIQIDSLLQLTQIPRKHLQQTILCQLSEAVNEHGLNKSDLKYLDEDGLVKLSQSLSVLKQAGITTSQTYIWAIQKGARGQLLRLFLPGLSAIENSEYRKALVELLYQGAKYDAAKQGKALMVIKDKDLLIHAQQLNIRFVCVKQLQDLQISKEIIALAAEQDSVRAARFRQIIMKVDKECKAIYELLLNSSLDREKVGTWENAHEQYRTTLYSIAYDGITQPSTELRARLHKAEQIILNIVDPEMKSHLYNSLIIITNIVIAFFSLGLANSIKGRNTGNYWFFTQSPSGEKLRALDKAVIELINRDDYYINPC